jgi:hypothetical protein
MECDDKARGIVKVIGTVLKLVESPAARPFVYYNKQWKTLLAKWLEARRAYSTFRPVPNETEIAELAQIETSTWQQVQRFLTEEVAVEHP